MKCQDMSLSVSSDEELAHLAKMGKQEAFNLLYERLLPSVYARVRFKVPETDVEDVTQEIFIAVLKSLGNFHGQSKFSTWVRTITNRRIADYHRKKKPSSDEEYAYEHAVNDNLENHSEILERQDSLKSIQFALSRLPQNYQDILLMRFVDNMPFNEIARQNGQSIEATKSLFRRSIAALSQKIQEEEQHP
jgi:RNA polymerase sigma-70 factor (ECF subfamily)